MRCSRLRPAPEETPPSLWHTVCVSASPPMSMHKQTLQICSEGAPGRPRGALAASQVSFTGCPFHSSCPSCEQNPWPGAHLGLVGSLWVAAGWSWQFEPGTPPPHTHTHCTCSFRGLCETPSHPREPNPRRDSGRNAEAAFSSHNLRYCFILNNLLEGKAWGAGVCQGNGMQPA